MSDPALLTVEEADQLSRSVKKHKRNDDPTQPSPEEVMLDSDEPLAPWLGSSFADALKGSTRKPALYTGEGEDDPLDDLDISEVLHHQTADDGQVTRPIVDIPWNEYKQMWLPWRRALILKVLGKTFNFRILEQRLLRLCDLPNGCELIDIDDGYVIAASTHLKTI